MIFWILATSYWIHLLTTVIWLGGMSLLALVAWPALRRGELADNQWLLLQQRFTPLANASLVLLLVTGFVQMTNDSNYNGFLIIDSLWSGALLIKHIAFIGMVLVGAYVQFSLHPALARTALLAESKPHLAEEEQRALAAREILLLRWNLGLALVVLLCTALATAV